MHDLYSLVKKFFVGARENGLGAALGKTAAYVKRSCGLTGRKEAAI